MRYSPNQPYGEEASRFRKSVTRFSDKNLRKVKARVLPHFRRKHAINCAYWPMEDNMRPQHVLIPAALVSFVAASAFS
ncbi:MAG: hypothetical protein E5W01_18910, partial [Mesorhizobium sp.]